MSACPLRRSFSLWMFPGRWYWQLVFPTTKRCFQETVASHSPFNISVWGVSACCCYRLCCRDWGFGDTHEKQFACCMGYLRIVGTQFGQQGGTVVSTVAFDSQLGWGLSVCLNPALALSPKTCTLGWWGWMLRCLYVPAPKWTDDLSSTYPIYRPMSAGTGCSTLRPGKWLALLDNG